VFAVLEDMKAEMNIKSAWETIRGDIKISAKQGLGYYEMKKHKPCFHKQCSKKQTKML
jgi:hypothetical protein